MSHVQEINTLDELAGIRLRWQALLGETRSASFFQTFDWLDVYWRHVGQPGGHRLRVLVIESCDQVIGILPLVVRPEATRFGRVRVLTYPLDRWGTCFGPIGPHPTATLLSACGHLRRTARDWDLVDLRGVDRHGIDAGRTPRAMQAVGFTTRPEPWRRSRAIQLDGRWDDYWANRPKDLRDRFRLAEKNLAELGDVRFQRHRPDGFGDSEPRWDLFEACIEVASRGGHGSASHDNPLAQPELVPLLRDVHEAAADSGSLDLSMLWIDDRPVAFRHNVHHAGTVNTLSVAHDAEFMARGVEDVLLGRLVRDSANRGDTILDLGTASPAAHDPWLTQEITSYRYSHFGSATPRVQALRMRRWMARLSREHREKIAAVAT